MTESKLHNNNTGSVDQKTSLSVIAEFIEVHTPVKNKFNECVIKTALEHFNFLNKYVSKKMHTSSFESSNSDLELSNELLSKITAMISIYYYDIASYETSRDYALKKLETDKAANNYKGIAKSYTILGNIFTDLGDFEQAVDFHLKALKIGKSISNQDEIGVTYTNLGNIEVYKKNYDEALNYYLKANEILSSFDRLKLQLATNFHNLGIVYFYKNDFEKSYNYYIESRKIREEVTDRVGLGQTISNIALLHEKNGEEDKAMAEADNAISIQKSINDRAGLFNSMIIKSRLLFRKKNETEADELMEAASKIAQETGSDMLKLSLYENKYELYSDIGRWEEALINYEKFYEINKKIFNQKKDRKTSNLLLLYDLEQAKTEAEENDKIFKTLSGSVEDLSKLNKRLDELHQQKNEILNVAAHDLRNPVSNIKLLTEFLQKGEINSEAEEKEFYQMISRSAENMLSMISDLLNINLLESSTYEIKNDRFLISDLIKDLVNIYKIKAEVKNINIVLNIQNEPGILVADKSKLSQIIDNLLSNAIKFSPAGKRIYINVEEKNNRFFVSVKDEGPGFSETDLKNAFNKFSKLSARPTAGEDSTGLGLFIIKKLVELLNGSIKIISKKNEGAEMIIELPAPALTV